MTTSSSLWLALAALSGVGLGAFFFCGLYWTIRKGLGSRVPAIWFLLSLLVRVSVVVFGFFLVVAGGSWSRLVACGLGFVGARIVVGRLIEAGGATHAP